MKTYLKIILISLAGFTGCSFSLSAQQDTSRILKNQNTIIKNQKIMISNQDTLKKNTNSKDLEMTEWKARSKKMDKNFDLIDRQNFTMDSILNVTKPLPPKKKIK